ncbi:MAG: hypothetical protein KGS72_11330 [Cyanobacteria bacterium REEB67]|nr:hypothetical protein [Cyanobacteria bacterium REEB67]
MKFDTAPANLRGWPQPASAADLSIFAFLLAVLVWMVTNLTIAPYIF